MIDANGASELRAVGYGTDYSDWKAWNDDSFARLNKSEERYFKSELKKTRSQFPPESTVLEIGFGNGTFLAFGRKMHWRMQGTEVNAGLVETATEAGFDVRYCDNLRSYADASFDLIVAFDVLEHISQNDLLDFLRDVKRVLKEQGCFIARFPNGDSPFGLIHQNGDFTHLQVIGSGKVKLLASQLAFDIAFIGSEAEPIWGVAPTLLLHRLLFVPIKKAVGILVKLVFFPACGPAFCSANLVVIFRPIARKGS